MKSTWFKKLWLTLDLNTLEWRESLPQRLAKHKKKLILAIAAVIVFFVVVFPYIRVGILTARHGEELAGADLSALDNVYGEGKVKIYDVKVYAYHERKTATVLLTIGDREFGEMSELRWDEERKMWYHDGGRVVWTSYGGNAGEFHWPLYDWDKLFGDPANPFE